MGSRDSNVSPMNQTRTHEPLGGAHPRGILPGPRGGALDRVQNRDSQGNSVSRGDGG